MKIAGVMRTLAPDQQNLVRTTVIDRLRKAIPSQQDAAGEAFSADAFLTNRAIDPPAKDALFGASGTPKPLRAGLDSLANTMSAVRNSTLDKNPSGTGEAALHGAGLFALLESGGAALFGHPSHLAAVGAAVVANNLLACALTSRRLVTWLALTAKLPRSALPNAVTQPAKMGQATGDADARDLADYARTSAVQTP
jgi:hypothetical protein